MMGERIERSFSVSKLFIERREKEGDYAIRRPDSNRASGINLPGDDANDARRGPLPISFHWGYNKTTSTGKEETLWLAKLAKSLHEATADGSSGSIWAAITKRRSATTTTEQSTAV
jgi:hypothetical protein